MPTGTIGYAAPITGVRFKPRFQPTEITNLDPSVEKIVLEVENDERLNDELLKITFHLIDVFTSEDAQSIAEPILPSIVNRLAFYRDIPVGEPYNTGSWLPKGASGSSYTVTGSLRIGCSSSIVVGLREDAHQELVKQLEQPYTHDDRYSLYRAAISQSDVVARFMFLYSILEGLQPEDKRAQKCVDKFIRGEIPSVPESPHPKKTNVNETIYSRLRNEVAHRRPGTTPERTRREIQNNIVTFQGLVRLAIKQAVDNSSPLDI
jgi:hypothetical protein